MNNAFICALLVASLESTNAASLFAQNLKSPNRFLKEESTSSATEPITKLVTQCGLQGTMLLSEPHNGWDPSHDK